MGNAIQVVTRFFCLDSPPIACHVRDGSCADIYKARDECGRLAQASSFLTRRVHVRGRPPVCVSERPDGVRRGQRAP